MRGGYLSVPQDNATSSPITLESVTVTCKCMLLLYWACVRVCGLVHMERRPDQHTPMEVKRTDANLPYCLRLTRGDPRLTQGDLR